MENFHSVKQQAGSRNLIRTAPTPAPTTPPPTSTTLSTPTSSSAYPISYSSPHGKVFLSTKYITHSSTTPHPNHFSTIATKSQPHRQQARSTRNPHSTTTTTTTS